MMRRRALLGAALGAWLLASSPGAAQENKAPQLRTDLNEQVVMLPVKGSYSTELETTLFRPDGDGPFPLVIINHGKAPGNPRFQERARYTLISEEFVKRGYLVALPMRRGFSKSGGGYVEPGCNMTSNGLMQAEDVRVVLDVLVKRPDVDPERILIIGQSHGGLTTLAFGTMNYPGVRGLINFAGGLATGRTGATSSCQWDLSLTAAFGSYAKTTTVPSLWFYGDNDSYWGPGPELPKRMHDAYAKAGGKAQLVLFGVFEDGDAHGMIQKRAGLKIWVQPVEEFLTSIGMPAAGKKPASQ